MGQIILDPISGQPYHLDSEGKIISMIAYKRLADEQKEVEKARASVRDTWLSEHTRETQAFIEERRAYALGDPGDEMPGDIGV